jgi:addiction module RelE/StbE family toxin
MEIVWSPRSLEKIEQIGSYIDEDAPERAWAFVDRLVESVERLRKLPMSGQITRENPAFRQVVTQGYRVVYRIQERAIEIVTVIAPKEDSDHALKD